MMNVLASGHANTTNHIDPAHSAGRRWLLLRRASLRRRRDWTDSDHLPDHFRNGRLSWQSLKAHATPSARESSPTTRRAATHALRANHNLTTMREAHVVTLGNQRVAALGTRCGDG